MFTHKACVLLVKLNQIVELWYKCLVSSRDRKLTEFKMGPCPSALSSSRKQGVSPFIWSCVCSIHVSLCGITSLQGVNSYGIIVSWFLAFTDARHHLDHLLLHAAHSKNRVCPFQHQPGTEGDSLMSSLRHYKLAQGNN